MTPLPKELYAARDAVIDGVYEGIQSPENLALLESWLALEGWDNICGEGTNDEMAINLWHFRRSEFNDEEFEYGYLEPDQTITDQMRIDHARMKLNERVENGDDGDFFPSYASFKIERDDGNSAVIGCTISMVPGGPEPDWCGAFKTHEDFVADLIECGIIPLREIHEIPDSEILSYWEPRDLKGN